jgi:hypothetical protein
MQVAAAAILLADTLRTESISLNVEWIANRGFGYNTFMRAPSFIMFGFQKAGYLEVEISRCGKHRLPPLYGATQSGFFFATSVLTCEYEEIFPATQIIQRNAS